MIELNHVCVKYYDTERISKLNLRIEDNQLVAIVGQNGSGKSTLLRAMAGLLSSEGEIRYDNGLLSKMERIERAKKISYLPQVRDIPSITAEDLVAHGRHPYLGFAKKMRSQDKEMIYQAARATKIEDLLGRQVSSLSGGERQRVYLAMLLAQDCPYVLLDEPTTYLDLNAQLEILEIISQMHKMGKTVVVVMHDLPQAFSFAQKICVLQAGKVICYDSPQSTAAQQAISEIYGFSIKETKEENTLLQYTLFQNNEVCVSSENEGKLFEINH